MGRTIGLVFQDGNIPETITDTTTEPNYDDMKKSELISLCEEKGMSLTAAQKRSKATLIEALKAEV